MAKTMIDSVELHHPGWKKYIFLVDEFDPAVDYSFFSAAELVRVSDPVVPGFSEMMHRYSIMELNSAIRPFIFKYIIKQHPGTNGIYYIDPDMFVYNKLDLVDELLVKNDIVITPHFLGPVPIDDHSPFENLALNYGTYNLGFLALNPAGKNVQDFLEWWGERTRKFGYIDVANGYFVDQIWFNLVPVFFKQVHTLMHKGYNMAAWNLYERKIMNYNSDGTVLLEGSSNLVIYHFSSWNYKTPGKLSSGYSRFDFENRPDLEKLYSGYYEKLKANRMESFSQIPCRLPVKKTKTASGIKKVLSPAVGLMKKVWQRI